MAVIRHTHTQVVVTGQLELQEDGCSYAGQLHLSNKQNAHTVCRVTHSLLVLASWLSGLLHDEFTAITPNSNESFFLRRYHLFSAEFSHATSVYLLLLTFK